MTDDGIANAGFGQSATLVLVSCDCSAIEVKRLTVSLKVEREELLNQRLWCCLMRAAG